MQDAEILVTPTADIVAGHVGNNDVAASVLPRLIKTVHEALTGLGEPAAEPEPKQKPAVPIRTSVTLRSCTRTSLVPVQ